MGRFCVILLTISTTILSGCDESEVVSIRIRLDDHRRGHIVVNSLQVPTGVGPVESSGAGISWQHRVNLVSASGRFDDLSQLRIEDLSFSAGSTDEQSGFVQVRIPRGEDARWPNVMTLARPGEIKEAAHAFGASGHSKLGTTLKIMIELPGHVVAQGTKPQLRQIKTKVLDLDQIDNQNKVRDRVATLLIPLKIVRQAEDAIVWHVMWQR